MRALVALGLIVLACSSGGCSEKAPPASAAADSPQLLPGPAFTFRFRWVCESGHTVKRTGPYTTDYNVAAAGGLAHDKAHHGGLPFSRVEISAVP